jgi:hypothetical protein
MELKMNPNFKCLTRLILTLTLAPPVLAAPVVGDRLQDSGFELPYAGDPLYLGWTPQQAQNQKNVNEPLGQKKADLIAKAFGFRKSKALTHKQYLLLISGQGVGGGTPEAFAAAKTIDASVNYLTNSSANVIFRSIDGALTPITLGSYGLIVNEDGLLESAANSTSPCRQVNVIIQPSFLCPLASSDSPSDLPCGYLNDWLRANGASDTLIELYQSAFFVEALFGSKSQEISGVAQLVPNKKPAQTSIRLGMSMAPTIWVTNFLLIYTLNPKLAALMPAYWSPIPDAVSAAIASSPSGQVSYSSFQSYFTP